ncbi:MAG: 2,3-bisphosphoglycerate-independent phosphoglycerate mutase [Patescibacteria group bacterium]
MRPKPAVLMILDGWGIAPPGEANAISQAKTPVINRLIATYPAMTIAASGTEVGLRAGEMGNSEVGHLNIGAGRVYYQTLPRINKAISDGSFFSNQALSSACQTAKKNKSKLHFIGLVSPGGVHSHQEHLYALLELAKEQKVKDVFVHAFMDGRDTIYNAGKDFIGKLQDKMKELKVGKIASMSGRFYAMDRDNHWDRVEKAYLAMAQAVGPATKDPIKALEASYAANVFDEEFVPMVVQGRFGKPIATIEDGDVVVFFNFRADRARQMTKVFVADDFNGFKIDKRPKVYFVAMTDYEKDLQVPIAFPPDLISECLAKVISDHGLRQLHIAETEKYAHITFFLNGQKEDQFAGEDRAIIPSPHVPSYDQKPEMSARELADRVIKEIKEEKYDFIAINFANADMVGHTGDVKATIRGVEVLDKCVGDIIEQVLLFGGVAFITADHGNGEELANLQTGEKDKEHSTNPVPFIIVGEKFEGQNMGLPEGVGSDLSLVPPVGILGDIAPTILKVMELPHPPEMTGHALI